MADIGDASLAIPASERWLWRSGVSSPQGRTALALGAAALEIEKAAQAGKALLAAIPAFGAATYSYDLDALARVAETLSIQVLSRKPRIRFVKRRFQETLNPATEERASAQVCLFSAGLDSYVGLRLAARRSSVVGLFCAHRDQAHLIRLERDLLPYLGGVHVRSVSVPALGATGYIQLRGFLYVMAAGAVLSETGGSKIVVPESGPTMFQPAFSPADAVTMTTHPRVMRLAREALEIILSREIEIVTPLSSLTKAEITAIAPDPEVLMLTHSCISQRFGNHDGTCYGCVIRRLGFLAAGVKDVKYRRDPTLDPSADAGNLLTVLRFSADLLSGFRNLSRCERDGIDRFARRDLFRRFSLDNLAALHVLVRKGLRLRPDVRRAYQSGLAAVGAARLQRRLDSLKTGSFRAQWKARVD